MAAFTVNMKAFTDRLKSSIEDRDESLASVRQATTDLLDGARNFLDNVALEHDARAEYVHTFMSSTRANREETVKAMRDSHCESLAAMSDEMHRTLDAATKSRVEEVNAFMATSHADRCASSKAMRDSHKEELAAMSEELHQTLDEANRARLEAVGMMRDTFQTARAELSSDLRDAAKAWREFAGRHDAAPTSKPETNGHGEAKKTAPVGNGHGKRKVSHSR
jgi:gas vesicle protein